MHASYVSNLNEECFGVSLQNFLIVQGDTPTARVVRQRYRGHPLVLAEGKTYGLLTPRILRDVTDGRYHGILTIDARVGMAELEQELPIDFRSIASGELERGAITLAELPITYTTPAIVYLVDGEGRGHCLVQKGHGIFIDNGQITPFVPDNLPVIGIMAVRRNQPEHHRDVH